jgi:hypothetical protein
MSTQPYRQDDDDLFSYDPSLDSESTNYSETSSSPTSDNNLLDGIYRNFDKFSLDDKKSSDFKINLAHSLYEAYHGFIDKSLSLGYVSSINDTLDILTQGRFGKLFLTRVLEQSIFRRLAINALLSAIIDGDSEDENRHSFKSFLLQMNISIDDDFISTYFSSLLRISNHSLNLNRAMYINLCNELSITPHSLVLDNDVSGKDLDNAIIDSIPDYQDKYLNNLYNIASSDSFIDKVKNVFSSENQPNVLSI